MLKRNTLDMLYKITVRSVIDYALPVYAHNLKLTELARLDRIQYRAAKLVTGALHFTNNKKTKYWIGLGKLSDKNQFSWAKSLPENSPSWNQTFNTTLFH